MTTFLTAKQLAAKFPLADLSGLPTSNPGGGKPWLSGGAVVVGNYAGNTVDWSAIFNKPTEFPPAAHTHSNLVPYSGASQAVDLGSQNLMTTGHITGNRVLLGAGSAASPSLRFDSTTGFYRPSPDEIGVACFGIDRVRILSNGVVLVNTTTWDGGSRFQINGGITTNSNFVAGGSITAIGNIRSASRLETSNGVNNVGKNDLYGFANEAYFAQYGSGGSVVNLLQTSGGNTLAATSFNGNVTASRETTINTVASMDHGLTVRSTGAANAIRVMNTTGTSTLWSVSALGQMVIPALGFIGFAHGSEVGDPQQIITAGGPGLGIKTNGGFFVATGGTTQRFAIDTSGNVTASGNVGIGGTPSWRMHFQQSSSTTTKTGGIGSEIVIENPIVSSAGPMTGIRFVTPVSSLTGQASGRILSGFSANGYAFSYITLQTVSGSNTFVDALTLQNGSVAVGQGTAAVKLDVAGSLATGTVGTEDMLQLVRAVNPGVSWPQAARFSLGRYSTSGITTPRSRLDIKLSDTNTGATPEVTVMTLQGNGAVLIGTTTDDGLSRLQVNGSMTASGFITSGFRSLSANPTTLDISAGQEQLVLNTTSGELRRWANVSGSMRSILYS